MLIRRFATAKVRRRGQDRPSRAVLQVILTRTLDVDAAFERVAAAHMRQRVCERVD